MQNIFKVINMAAPRSFQTKEGTTSYARDITLQMIGGQYADKIVATLFDNSAAEPPFKTGDVVTASVEMFVNNYNGRDYQSNTISEIVRLRP